MSDANLTRGAPIFYNSLAICGDSGNIVTAGRLQGMIISLEPEEESQKAKVKKAKGKNTAAAFLVGVDNGLRTINPVPRYTCCIWRLSMPEEIDLQSIIDEEHLKLLSLGYMISAGFAAFFAFFGLLYLFIGIVMSIALAHVRASASSAGQMPPAFIGWIFAGIGLVFFLLAGAVAFARFWAARCIKQRKSRTFCMVIAGLGCLEFPYGTALGVLSFIVLGRASVAKQFTPKPGP
jgi:hypothetical protein